MEWWSLNTDEPVRMGETYYHYDTANQLVREDNMWLGKTFVWTYDDAGNITSCKEYAYINNWEEVTGTPTKTNTYTYGDSSWGDLLTAINDRSFTYDATERVQIVTNFWPTKVRYKKITGIIELCLEGYYNSYHYTWFYLSILQSKWE